MSFGAGFGVPAPAAAEVASAKDYVYLELESIVDDRNDWVQRGSTTAATGSDVQPLPTSITDRAAGGNLRFNGGNPTTAIGGYSLDGAWGWVVSGSSIDVFELTRNTRIASHSVGHGLGAAVIRQVVEIPSVSVPDPYASDATVESPTMLALLLEAGSGDGRVLLFEPARSAAIATIVLPHTPNEIAYIDPGTATRICGFAGVLAVGTTNGNLLMIDLRLDDLATGVYPAGNHTVRKYSYSSGRSRSAAAHSFVETEIVVRSPVTAIACFGVDHDSNAHAIKQHGPLIAVGHENGGFTVWKFEVTESDPEDLDEQEEFKVGLPLECDRVRHSMLDDETETDSLECTGVVGFAYMQPTGDENQLLVVAWNAFRKSDGLGMGFVRIFDGETSFQHLLGKGCPQNVRSAVSSKCISLSVLDERAKPTASSTGCWDENDRFAVVQVVWEARAVGDDADASEVHIGFLDIDEHLSVTDEDRYLCFPPDESDAKYDIMYFGIYSLGSVGSTPLDVRVNPASVTDFRMRPTSLMGCRTLDKDGGVLNDARQKLPRVTTASFEVAYLSAQQSTLVRFDSSQQRILASLSEADATHLSQPATLFKRCAMAELIPDQGFVVHDQVCLIRPDGDGSLPTADDVGTIQGFGSFEFALGAMVDDLDARIKEQEQQDGEGEPYELLERRAKLYGERKKLKKRLKSGKFEYYVEVSRERRQANVPETYWYKASSLKLFDQGHDAVRQRRVLMNLAVETNRPQLILNFFQQAAEGGDRAAVLKWATDTFEKLERKAKGRLPEDGQGNDHDFGRMCVLDTLRTIYSYVQQADAEATLGSLSNLERMRHKIEAEWSRSRLTDWLFATHMLPQKKDTIKVLLPLLGTQYANLRASRGARQSYPKPGDPVLLVDALMRTGEAVYPPSTLKGFLAADAGRMSGTEKSHLFYYFLLDYDAHTGDCKAEEFARLFDLPVSVTRTLATFRYLDNEVFTPDGNDFTEFMLADATVINDQDVLVLRALYDLKYIETSLEFVQIKQPNFGEKQDVFLCANILITNKRINDAFFYIRDTGKDSDIHADLVEHFCTRALEQKQIGQVIRLPLSQEEEEVLLEVLQGSDRPTAKEALVLYLVHRARYVEAFRTHRQYMESAPELGETDKNRHEDLKKLLDGYFKLLPRVQRKLARSDRDLAGPSGGRPAFKVPMTPRTKGPTTFSTAHIVQNAFLRPAVESMMDESGDSGALDTTTFAGPPVTPTRLRNSKYSLQFATPTAVARPSFSIGPEPTPESEMEMESPVVISPKAVKQQAPSSILKRPKSGKNRGGIRFVPDVAEEDEDEKVEINPDSSCEDITFNIAPRDLEAINALSPVDDSPSGQMDDSSNDLPGPQVLFRESDAMESEPASASSTPGAIAASQPARSHGGALQTPPGRTRANVVTLAPQFAPSPLVQATSAMEFTPADEDDGVAAGAPVGMTASTPRAGFGDQPNIPGSAAASPVGWGSSTPTLRETKVSQFQPSPSPMGGGGGMVPRMTKVSQFAPASPARSNLRTSVTASQFAQAVSPQVFGLPAVQADVSVLSGGGSQPGTPKRPEKVRLTPTAQSPRSQFVAHDSPLAAPSPLARTASGASSASSASTAPVVNSPHVSAAPTPMLQDEDLGHAASPTTPMEDSAPSAESPAPESPAFVALPPARRTRTPAAAKVKSRRTKSAALPGHGQNLTPRRSSRLRTRKTKP